ncbi:MAG: hypothetical protein JO180_08090 [Gemmatirosa sp.]|nr:hypothetical protein [Gemmatirosa sp.]
MGIASISPYDQLPTALRRERDGANAIERLAIDVVRRETAAMPASLVVQLALWPDEVATWAREIRSSESLVYNMLAARKPYARARAALADRLGVGLAVVDHLVESARPQPSVRSGPPDPEADAALASPRAPIDWRLPPFPRRRDGTNPIERRAVRVVETDVASMPAASVVGLAMWPETLAAWSRAERLKSSVVWATLAGSPSAPVRDALARRLGASLRELDALVTQARAVPSVRRAPALPDAPPPDAPASPPPAPSAPSGSDEQLGFGF